MMRNTELRKLIDSITAKVNEGIENGFEPLALAMGLWRIADSCDRLAERLEKQEQEEQAKAELKEASESMEKNE